MAVFLGTFPLPLSALNLPGFLDAQAVFFLGFVPCFDRGHHLVTFWGMIHTRTFFFSVKLHVRIILCSALTLDWWLSVKFEVRWIFSLWIWRHRVVLLLLLLRSSMPFWFPFFVSDLFLISTPLLEVPGLSFCPRFSKMSWLCVLVGLLSSIILGQGCPVHLSVMLQMLSLCCSVWWPPDAKDKQALKCGWCDQGTACLVLSNFK